MQKIQILRQSIRDYLEGGVGDARINHLLYAILAAIDAIEPFLPRNL